MSPLRCVWQRNVRPILTVLWELLRDGFQFLNIAARSRFKHTTRFAQARAPQPPSLHTAQPRI